VIETTHTFPEFCAGVKIFVNNSGTFYYQESKMSLLFKQTQPRPPKVGSGPGEKKKNPPPPPPSDKKTLTKIGKSEIAILE